jgi:hypothetical protein
VWPIGPWSEDKVLRTVGKYQARNFLENIRGIGWKMLSAAGLSLDEIEDLAKSVEKEISDSRIKVYSTLYVSSAYQSPGFFGINTHIKLRRLWKETFFIGNIAHYVHLRPSLILRSRKLQRVYQNRTTIGIPCFTSDSGEMA